jgi:hypothetical protein
MHRYKKKFEDTKGLNTIRKSKNRHEITEILLKVALNTIILIRKSKKDRQYNG